MRLYLLGGELRRRRIGDFWRIDRSDGGGLVNFSPACKPTAADGGLLAQGAIRRGRLGHFCPGARSDAGGNGKRASTERTDAGGTAAFDGRSDPTAAEVGALADYAVRDARECVRFWYVLHLEAGGLISSLAYPMKSLIALLTFPLLAFAEVRVELVPEKGVQPQAAVDLAGTAHLLYLTGAPGASDVHYVSRARGAREWSAPIVVNSEPGSAIAMGTIRGAQMTLGKDGTVHFVWNGAGVAGTKPPRSPLWYSRIVAGTGKSEPQRDLFDGGFGLDGGASVAADSKGAVFVVWHGPGAETGETSRVVRVRKSADGGVTFALPVIATAEKAGVCACCSLRAGVGTDGTIYTIYRAAHSVGQRDMTLLSSRDGGATFRSEMISPWAGNTCPMSSAALSTGRMAWETDGKIFTSTIGGATVELGKGKHPSLATNARGETLAVWTTGTGWARGGALEWTILGSDGKSGKAGNVAAWSFATAFAEPSGDFVILR